MWWSKRFRLVNLSHCEGGADAAWINLKVNLRRRFPSVAINLPKCHFQKNYFWVESKIRGSKFFCSRVPKFFLKILFSCSFAQFMTSIRWIDPYLYGRIPNQLKQSSNFHESNNNSSSRTSILKIMPATLLYPVPTFWFRKYETYGTEG